MKKNSRLIVAILVLHIASIDFIRSQSTQIDINFNDGQPVFVPIHSDELQPSYALSVTDGILKIATAKRPQDWSFLGLFNIQLDITALPTLQFSVKTDVSGTFIVRIKSPKKSNPEEWSQIEKPVALEAGDFQYIFFDLTGDIDADPDFDAANIKEIHLECSNGWENSFTGNVFLDYLKIAYPNQSKPSGGTWFQEDFNDGVLPAGLSFGTDYGASAENGAMLVDIHKDGRWTPFALVMDSLYDFSASPTLNIRVRTDENLVLQAFLVDADGGGYKTEQVGSQYLYTELVSGKNEYRQVRLFKGNDFLDVTFDFSGASGTIIDLTRIEKIIFTVNGTAMTCSGKIIIDEIRAGSVSQKKAYIGQIPDQHVYKNTSGNKSILVPEIMNASSLSLSGGDRLIRQVTVDPVSYSTSTENNQPVTYGFTRIHYSVIPDSTGSDTIVVTAAGKAGFADNKVKFLLTIAGNSNPTLDPLGHITIKTGTPYTVPLAGIGDGDPEKEQALVVTAFSDSIIIVDTVLVDYTSDNRSGRLVITPIQAGTTTVQVKISDEEGAFSIQSFEVIVFDQINNLPTINKVFKSDVINNTGEQTIRLTGISDGDDGTQTLTIAAVSSMAGIITDPVVEFEPGDSVALLKFTPVSGSTGKTNVTVTVADNGGTAENDGNKSAIMEFEIETLNPPVSGYVIDLSDPNALSWLSPENNGIEYFLAIVDTLGSKALRITMKDKWTYGGIWFQLPVELNLKTAPAISYEVFSVGKQTWHWNYLYDAHGTDGNIDRNSQNSEANQFPATAGVWSNLLFDYRDPGDLNNANGEPIDAGRISAVLLNMHDTKPSWPFTNATATVYYRNIRLGDSCSLTPATPACSIDPVAGTTVFENSGEHTLVLSGISNGKGSISGVNIVASSFNSSIIPKPVVSSLNSDGTASLTFTATETGSSAITVRVTATGSATATTQFNIAVIKADPVKDAIVAVDMTEEHQTIRGFGSFEPESRNGDLYAIDLGASVVRLGIIGNQWEPVNDNDDPNILNMDGFNYDAFDWEYLRKLKENGVEYFVITSWSPPAWMKRNLSLDHKEQAIGWGFTDNRMDPIFYDEFAESMLGLVKAFKEMAGIDVLALGLQNEPFFNEPYPSAILDAPHFIDLIKIVSAKLKSNGFGQVGFFMPEQVFGIGGGDASCIGFLEKLQLDPDADAATGYFAVHGYDQTGITPGFPDYSEWQSYYNAATKEPNPKEMWMTETAIGYNGWSSSLSLAGALHGSLWAGNISWWTTFGFSGDYISGTKPNTSFYAAKSYFKYIRPGAKRVTTGTNNGDVMPTAFKNTDGSFVVVLVNKSGSAITTRLTGNNLPDEYTRYLTSARDNFRNDDTLKLSQGAFVLPASSITTLVATGNSVLSMNQVNDVVVDKNSGESVVNIAGISNGTGGIEGLSLTYEISNEALFSIFTLSGINGDGTATISFTPAPEASGFSQVTLSLTNGDETRSMTFFIIVGIPTGNVETAVKDVLIYPNPARDRINVEIPVDAYDRLRLIDNTGRVVMQKNIVSEKTVIDAGGLDKGIYFLELSGNNKKNIFKVSMQ
jgi:O-glycosyl hydrolase